MLANVRPLTSAEFNKFRDLVETEVGIHLSPIKHALVNARLLTRIRELGLATFGEYYERVVASPHDELVNCINAICTNETHFFREPQQFEFVRRELVPLWRELAQHGGRDRRVRVWSAACSTGEEPYTLAMLLASCLPESWQLEVVATDVSTKVLERAANAVYPMSRLHEIPREMQRRYLLQGVGPRAGTFRIGPELRRQVSFRRENLVRGDLSTLGKFELILCRNVLMYFRPETRLQVVRQLLRQLGPGGHFFVGHSESLHGQALGIETVAPTMYRLAERA